MSFNISGLAAALALVAAASPMSARAADQAQAAPTDAASAAEAASAPSPAVPPHPRSAAEDTAAAALLSEPYHRCMKVTAAAMPRVSCMSNEIGYQYGQLDSELKHLIAITRDPGERERLNQDQTAWAAAETARCGVYRHKRGSLARLRDMDCGLDEVTYRRLAVRALIARRHD